MSSDQEYEFCLKKRQDRISDKLLLADHDYQKYQYISLSIDAGKIGSINYYDILLTSAYLHLKENI